MQHITFNGNCPECNLTDKTVKMRLNLNQELECPVCNLRVYHDENRIAMIYRNRGKNEFALQYTPNLNKELIFCESDLLTDNYTNGNLLLNNKSLKNYLNQTNNKTYKNIKVALLESYIDWFFNNANEDYYQLMTKLNGIDISQIVFKNKAEEQNLFCFLHASLACYADLNMNLLANFKMQELANILYNKHIYKNLDIINEDLFLQKIAFQNLILDLIDYLYATEKVK